MEQSVKSVRLCKLPILFPRVPYYLVCKLCWCIDEEKAIKLLTKALPVIRQTVRNAVGQQG